MFFDKYARWLHTRWPAGVVEPFPITNDEGGTQIPGVRIVGDLSGIPLLKFSADTGARAIAAFVAEADFAGRQGKDRERVDVAIIGGGVSGISAALEAKARGLSFAIFDAAQAWNTLHDFPARKPIYTYPTDMTPAGQLTISAAIKEALIEELEAQRQRAGVEVEQANVDHIERRSKDAELALHFKGDRAPLRALRVVIAIGRSGNYRKLGCVGEELDKVHHRLHDPNDFANQNVLIVGGGDSALESAIALAQAKAKVTIAYRGKEFSRPKPENIAQLGATSVRTLFDTKVKSIADREVVLTKRDEEETLSNDVVFAMIGREAPLDFFRRSGIGIRGEWSARAIISCVLFVAAAWFVYTWKAGTELNAYFSAHQLFPFNLPDSSDNKIGESALGHALGVSIRQPGFYYSLLYSLVIIVFGALRIRRRRTPYVTRQTLTLMSVQVLPLFLLPYFVLPTLGYLGAFDAGFAKKFADAFFPLCNYDYGREYWRAFGIVLAWPLFFWNAMNSQPLMAWLIVSLVQTFVLLPIIVIRWGKGAYCGWICSCGALAETLGDEQRQKMPHGPAWNRLNLVGQAILLWATLLFIARAVTWIAPNGAVGHAAARFVDATFYAHAWYDYYHLVDIFLAGIVGVGLYFWFSGRVWCRFACPLAALMHIYVRIGARFSSFRIFADKKKCISCNVCTSVCHQGIDVMSFANKGLPMEDPECVRCSACVQSCPTGVLSFGRTSTSGPIFDTLLASAVQIKEGKTHLRVVA